MDNEELEKEFHEKFIKSLIDCSFKITDDNKSLINFNLEFAKKATIYSMFFGVACQFNCLEEIIKLTGIDINDYIEDSAYDILFEILSNDNIKDKTNSINQIDKLGYNFKKSYSLVEYMNNILPNIHDKNNKNIIHLLVKKGLNINACYKSETALYYALNNNDYTLTDVLIDNGANPYIGNIMQLTDKKGFDHIINKYTNDIVKLLPLSHDIVRHIVEKY